MAKTTSIQLGRLKRGELEEAQRIVRLAFGTFLGLPNPLEFMGDRSLIAPRWRSSHVKVIGARENGRLIGSNVIIRWGSFGFFGPLTVLPEYWNRGIAQRLLEATMKVFDQWRVRQTGLFTFPHSVKHINLYQKFGYWPRYLTAVMARTPDGQAQAGTLLSSLGKSAGEGAIGACTKLTGKIDPGLDLGGEIGAILKQGTGDTVLAYTRHVLDGFAICASGPGSEGGAKLCYIKFAAARSGDAFDRLLGACDAFAASRGVSIEAGVNLAREDAFTRMHRHGYRTMFHGLAMQRPNAEGYNRADVYVMDDWR